MGRAAIISGASSGIGEATARRLAGEGAGIIAMSSSSGADAVHALATEIEQDGGRAIAIVGDIAEPETSARAVAAAVGDLGRLDCVVANAGITPRIDLREQTVEQFDRVLAVNVRGSYLLTAAAARAMAAADGGAIVCVGSTCSYRALEDYSAYSISKGGVVQLARSLGVALARYGVRANAVLPGIVDAGPAREELADPHVWAKERTRVPADRPARPEEIASLIAFLLSDEASYITGAAVAVDGGESAGWRSWGWSAVETAPAREQAEVTR